ncbi:MAG: potassium/proton antiporter [Candidatus Omnitrophota bacterium]
MTFTLEIFLLLAAVLTLISVLASKLSDRFAVPALLLFLIIGMIAGSEGLGGIYFDNYQAAKSIGIIALIFIIFLGGIDTSWNAVKPLFAPGIILSTAGVLLTALIVGFFAVLVLKFTLIEGLLLGAIVSSTDAAAVFSVLRSKKISLKGSLKPLLEFESGSNDPMAVFLTIGLLNILSNSGATLLGMAWLFTLNMGVGAVMGYLMARLTIICVNRIKLEYDGLYPVLTISLVLLTYALTTLISGNGFLAVYILGLLLSRSDFSNKKMLIRFHEGIAWLMQIIMFLALGLLVFPSQIVPIVGSGLLIAMILIFLARPISIFLCLIPFKFSLPEKLMISWVGLRGAVPIILATFPLLAGTAQSHAIFNIVFFVVVTSVLIQGTSIPLAAKMLGVQAPFDAKIKFPIELGQAEGIDATLTDLIVPYGSAAAGQTISQLRIPATALIILVSRAEKFIVPGGSTAIEDGDVLLVLANIEDIKTIQRTLATPKSSA